jgi:hypothetical protein
VSIPLKRVLCAVGDSLVVKQLKDCATRLHVSLDRAIVARGVPWLSGCLEAVWEESSEVEATKKSYTILRRRSSPCRPSFWSGALYGSPRASVYATR